MRGRPLLVAGTGLLRTLVLYPRGGVWNGERLLPEGFARFVTTPAPAREEPISGGGFWVEGTGRCALPRDAFDMSGKRVQLVFVVPSHDLVIVRMGRTRGGAPPTSTFAPRSR